MKIVINIVLVAIIAVLGYLLYDSIAEPIQFMSEYETRTKKVVNKLKEIRTAQTAYKDITGRYASDFDTLKQVLTTGEFTIEKIIGDADAGEEVRKEVIRVSALDSLNTLGVSIDSLEFIPYSNGQTFEVAADTMTYQSSLVSVVEVKTTYEKFMGKYAADEYKKYKKTYDPKETIKFGDLSKPSTTGNWKE